MLFHADVAEAAASRADGVDSSESVRTAISSTITPSVGPAILGTFKATTYAFLLALPLGLSAALYVSQLAAPRARDLMRTTMDSTRPLPTVAVGFVAALWLAPWLVRHVVVLALCPIVYFVIVAFLITAGRILRRAMGNRSLLSGWEFAAAVVVVPLAVALSWAIERALRGGGPEDWALHMMQERWGIEYQRLNAIVVAIGLAVPMSQLVFAGSYEASMCVSRRLLHASAAAGATPWQTIRRVVLPTAWPGFVAAGLHAFGRGAGETMIVLLAGGMVVETGLSPFTGMPTLSANAAMAALSLPSATEESEVARWSTVVVNTAILSVLCCAFYLAAAWCWRILARRVRADGGALPRRPE